MLAQWVQPKEKVLLVIGRGDSCAGRGVSCNWGVLFSRTMNPVDCRADKDDNTLHSNYVFGDSSIALRPDCSSCRCDNDGADFEIACAMADPWSTARNPCSNSCTVSSNKLNLRRTIECVGCRAPSNHTVDTTSAMQQVSRHQTHNLTYEGTNTSNEVQKP